MLWDFPQPFTLPLAPKTDDIDGLNHTNNAVYVRWCEEIGWAHSEALGLGLADYHRLDRAMAIRRGRWDLVCIELSSGRARRMPPEFGRTYLPAIVDPAT